MSPTILTGVVPTHLVGYAGEDGDKKQFYELLKRMHSGWHADETRAGRKDQRQLGRELRASSREAAQASREALRNIERAEEGLAGLVCLGSLSASGRRPFAAAPRYGPGSSQEGAKISKGGRAMSAAVDFYELARGGIQLNQDEEATRDFLQSMSVWRVSDEAESVSPDVAVEIDTALSPAAQLQLRRFAAQAAKRNLVRVRILSNAEEQKIIFLFFL